MCQSSLLALVQELDDTEVLCCQGNLCNTRIVNGIVTEPRVAADSPDPSEDDECIAPSGTASSSDHTASPPCSFLDEEDDEGIVYTPGGHINNETSTADHNDILADNSTGHENKTTPLHPGDVAVDESHDDLFTGYSEVETAAPATESGPDAAGDASATTNLDKNYSGAGNASSSNHGSVVVLVPIIVPKRNATATTTTSSSSEAANNDEAECEEEEKSISTGEHFIASREGDAAPTRSPESTVVLGGDHSSAGSSHSPATGAATGGENSVADGRTSPTNIILPIPYVASKENNTFVTGSGSPAREVSVSGSGGGTSRPKNKIPCKRSGSQRLPGLNLMASPEAEKQVMGDGISRNDAGHLGRNVPGKTHLPDKTNPYSGAFGLATNLGLFSLTLFLAALLH